MTVIFPKWTNRVPAIAAAAVVCGGAFVTFAVWYWFSPKYLEVGYAPPQPVAYSHRVHAGVMGMDCRYCHQAVEKGPHAAIPTTETCMNCHKTVYPQREEVAKVVAAHEAGRSVPWIKVHMLPDYCYFDHSVHLHAGVGCASCHGRIDQMEIVRQAEPLSMGWCLECHRNPENHLRPLDRITDMRFVPDPEQGRRFVTERNINPPEHCSACHR